MSMERCNVGQLIERGLADEDSASEGVETGLRPMTMQARLSQEGHPHRVNMIGLAT